MTGHPDIAVAILAGGEGSRIGGGKPLIELAGKTLVERAHDHARSWATSISVVLRSPGQLGLVQLPSIIDAVGMEGPLAGLAAALTWTASSGVGRLLAIPCDMPFLPDDLPQRLGAGIGECRAALASSGGRLHPVCSLWKSEAVEQLADYARTGKNSLNGFARHVGFVEVEWPATPGDPFFNINSQADLVTAEQIIQGQRDRFSGL